MVNLNIRPTRMVAPPQGRAALELVQFPLYSAAAFDKTTAELPNQVSFFNYALGQKVSGAGNAAAANATRFHTNMETANFLSAPKTFTVQQVRIVVAQAIYSTSPTVQDTTTTSATARTSDLMDDVLKLGSMAFRFYVGPKDYVGAPLWAIAGNTGLGGTASVSVSNTNTAAAGLIASTPYYCGKSWTIRTWPVLIANQQSFGAELTNSFSKAAGNRLAQQRLVFCILEGVLGREVS